jgi:archaetidylinositol phosphate synthase
VKNTSEQVRVNDILLGPLERPALKWLAAHTPAWITPDRYTALGVLGAFIILIGYVLSRYNLGFFWLASFGFFVNWLGDSLDGSLARYRHIERPVYGFYIDHVTDAFTETVIFVGLGLSPFVNFDIAMLALVAYLLMSILAYVRTCVVGRIPDFVWQAGTDGSAHPGSATEHRHVHLRRAVLAGQRASGVRSLRPTGHHTL